MRFRTSPSVDLVAAPPIAEARSWVEQGPLPADLPLIDLSQAVPGYPPPPELTAHLGERLSDPAVHRYTDIPGLPELRSAHAERMSEAYGGGLDARHVAITAGCNQAYCLAMMALAGPGDEVLLPQPEYFNHRMWLDGLGIRGVPVPFDPERGGMPDPAAVAARITQRTRALVLITPNNPTGAVFPPDLIDALFDLARARGIALVVDETYLDFRSTADPPHRLFQRPDWEDTLVHLYSFSKVYCLTGHRVGSAIAAPAMIERIVKLMDSVAICAPRLGQEAALFGSRELGDFRARNRRLMADRAAALEASFQGRQTGYRLVSCGAYFAYLAHPFSGVPAAAVARDLVRSAGLLTLPGSMFGEGQDGYLRVAFANVERDALDVVIDRLARHAAGPAPMAQAAG